MFEKKTGLAKPTQEFPPSPWRTGRMLSPASAVLYPPTWSSYGRPVPRRQRPSELDLRMKYEDAQLQRSLHWRATATPMLKMSRSDGFLKKDSAPKEWKIEFKSADKQFGQGNFLWRD